MVPAAIAYRWPKRHEHCVEHCAALHVTTVLAVVDAGAFTHHRLWTFPELPMIRLVPRWGGVCWRWWLLCPRCENRVENLYRPPGAEALDWRCRRCHGLIYASQRYGYRHPLRRNPRNWTQRKRRTAQRLGAKHACSLERLQRTQRRTVTMCPALNPETERWAATVADGLRRVLAGQSVASHAAPSRPS